MTLGGRNVRRPTMGTDYLVVGNGGGGGRKGREVRALQATGSLIRIVSEDEFVAALNRTP